MKNNGLAIFLGCCVISIGIIVAGYFIAEKLPGIINIPSQHYVVYEEAYGGGTGSGKFGEFLSFNEAAAYISVQEYTLTDLIGSGKLDGTFIKARYRHNNDEYYVFIRDALRSRISELAVE